MSELMVTSTQTAEVNLLGGVLTAVFLIFFVGWMWWAYAPSRAQQHEAAGRLPLEEDSSHE